MTARRETLSESIEILNSLGTYLLGTHKNNKNW